MKAKTKTKVSKKAQRKLALNKETIRDLSVGDKAEAVRGGYTLRTYNTLAYCFGTLA